MLSRLPKAVVALVSAHLPLRDFVRLRRVSRTLEQASRLVAAQPRAIAVDGPLRFCARGAPLELSPLFSAANLVADYDPRTDAWLDASDERPLYPLPRGLLALDPTHFSARVDPGRLAQLAASARGEVAPVARGETIGSSSARRKIERSLLGAALAALGVAVPVASSAAGDRLSGLPATSLRTAAPPPSAPPPPPPPSRAVTSPPCLGKSLRHLSLRLDMRPWGVNAVRSLAPLECLTHLETLEVDGSASNAALSIVWPRLPALTRFRIASHSDVEQHDLAVFARAFPALTDLGHVCLSATHIDINLPAVVPHLRALACRLVARPSGLRAIAPLPPRIERLEVRITVKDDFDVSLAPGQLIMPLFALRAYPLLAVLHLRIGYVGPRAPSSYDPFALLYALPTLRHLEIVAYASVRALVARAPEPPARRDPAALSRTEAAAPSSSDGPTPALPLWASRLRSLAIVCLCPEARIVLPAARFPHLESLRIVAAECDLAPFTVPATARIDRTLAASWHLTE